jgi:hypothetical protein
MDVFIRFIPPYTKGFIMFFGYTETIKSLYGMDFKPMDTYLEKRKAAIEYLGDKYLLAKLVERKNG